MYTYFIHIWFPPTLNSEEECADVHTMSPQASDQIVSVRGTQVGVFVKKWISWDFMNENAKDSPLCIIMENNMIY